MKVLVTGANGQLGKSIRKVVSIAKQKNDYFFVGRNELDFSKTPNIERFFNKNEFNVVINCAAFTAVDKAESEFELANQINHLAVTELAKIAQKKGIKVIHISTDYVFDGEKDEPYLESDTPNPVNAYGKTKLAGEDSIRKIMLTDAVIIRTSWVYSEFGNNFVGTMLKLGKERDKINVVHDQIGSPTYATDLARTILTIVEIMELNKVCEATQIYHYSNGGQASWCEFTREIFKIARVTCQVHPLKTSEYPTLAKRPKNTVMNKNKIMKKFSIKIIPYDKSLKVIQNFRE